MQNFLVEKQPLGDIESNYPHSPTDVPLSIQDYLEDMLSQGFALISTSDAANGPYWIFRVVAK